MSPPRLCDVIPDYRTVPGGMTDIRRLPTIRKTFPRVWARLLMGCSKEQTRILVAIWRDKFASEDVLRAVCRGLAGSSDMPSLLDAQSTFAEYLIGREYAKRVEA